MFISIIIIQECSITIDYKLYQICYITIQLSNKNKKCYHKLIIYYNPHCFLFNMIKKITWPNVYICYKTYRWQTSINHIQ